MASWRPWAAVGRQMAAKTAPEALLGGSWGGLGGSWAALGASLGRLGPARRSPGGPGGSGEGLREAISVLFWMVQREKLKKRPKTCYFNDFGKFFGQGLGCDSRLLFACLARVRQGR